ncbi:bleomycin resistance protein [Mucilaginibacter myungsuensis]|uniref:VOC family protein n=1 Tax=Mucilaginibacter myungsuensis TaxID=649104 RepID=A0A929L3I8_9SPHI|nr:VOC family protein [Mucilaginibacter myungsuensis]MBE9663809.1 VOC family protein [Mucilaginibacter myungsuensis]MDN3598476.1 VOC family protein [Mucilaginibacter myungsuensis]
MLNYAIPILASLNEEETIKFYTEKLGFTFHSAWDGYLIFSRDGVNIHLWPADDRKIAENTGCYVNVSDVDSLYAEYKPHGVIHPNGGDLQQMDRGMRQFSILDNNGNILHFGQSTQEDDE